MRSHFLLFCSFVSLAAVASARDFDVRRFGAVGDGVAKDTAAIQSAIDACAANGGGRVVLDDGRFLSGTITLKSGVELHLGATAVLQGSSSCDDYPERTNLQHVVSANLPRARNACFIYAERAHDIAITGRGTIDCAGTAFVRERPQGSRGKWVSFERIPGLLTPPRVVFFAGCSDVKVVDVKMVNQPAGWSYWIHDCDRVVFDRCTILADLRYPNNDGIHVNCSRDVLISNCRIETNDDSIIVRANSRSLAENRPCERVTVANCSLRSHCSCIRISYLNDGVVRSCVFSNLVMNDSQIGIRVDLPKFSEIPDRGREKSLVRDLTFSCVDMQRVDVPLSFKVADTPGTLCDAVEDIRFIGVTARGGRRAEFRGRPSNPLRRFVFTACDIDLEEPPVFAGCEGFRYDDSTFSVKERGQ